MLPKARAPSNSPGSPRPASLRVDGSPHVPPRLLAAGLFVGVLGSDLASKAWAAAFLTEPVRLADWLYLVLHRNSGMFLGTMPLSAEYWVVVFVAFAWFAWRIWRLVRVPCALCLAVVLAGMVGNSIGQAQGGVVDFIGIGPIAGDAWLVVNIADLALVGGGLALGIYLIRERVRRAPPPRESQEFSRY